MQNHTLHVGVVGAQGVGKTSLIERFCQDKTRKCLFCFYKETLSKLPTFKEGKQEEQQDFDSTQRKMATLETKKQTNWSVHESSTEEVKSLKWICRHFIVTHSIPWKGKISQDLYEYMTEITPLFCPVCQTVFVQYLQPTLEPCFFDKKISSKLTIRFIDTTEQSLQDPETFNLLLQLPVLILVFDPTQPISLFQLAEIMPKLTEKQAKAISLKYLFLVGLKADLSAHPEVDFSLLDPIRSQSHFCTAISLRDENSTKIEELLNKILSLLPADLQKEDKHWWQCQII